MKDKLKVWLEHRRENNEKIKQNPILSLKEWMKRLTLGVAIVILALAVAILQQYQADLQREKDRDREEARSEEERIQRSIEACFNYNEDQKNNRVTLTELIPELAMSFFEETPADAQALLDTPGGKEFKEFIAERNPYRQCSAECVIAHTTPDASRCEPAINEQGAKP